MNKALDKEYAWLNELDNNLHSLLNNFTWTRDSVLEISSLTKCSHNTHHFVHTTALSHHESLCRLVSTGLAKDKVLAMPDSVSCDTQYSKSSTKEDVESLQNIIQERMEKSAVEKEQGMDSSLSQQELLALMRDVKRRRQAYRRVHTARKTYTEILHEVIANQMEYLSELNTIIAIAHEEDNRHPSQSWTMKEDHPTRSKKHRL